LFVISFDAREKVDALRSNVSSEVSKPGKSKYSYGLLKKNLINLSGECCLFKLK
jgi:hypothetical protein